MQDYNYMNSNCFEITIEQGCKKFPEASELPKDWEENKRALIAFLDQVCLDFCKLYFLVCTRKVNNPFKMKGGNRKEIVQKESPKKQ